MSKKFLRILVLLATMVLAAVLLTACEVKPKKMEFSSPLTEDDRVYFTGQELDTYVIRDGKSYCRIPHIYITFSDGTKSEDVSHSDKVTFSGYDLSRTGAQVVKVTYTDENGNTIKDAYDIEVIESEILFIEADDPWHNFNGTFKVGDKFTTYEEIDGVPRGVTVWVYYTDEDRDRDGFFTNDAEMRAKLFIDTSECKLDENGCFTEGGTFTVHLTYENQTCSYEVIVIDESAPTESEFEYEEE